jgi:hypothetical protein
VRCPECGALSAACCVLRAEDGLEFCAAGCGPGSNHAAILPPRRTHRTLDRPSRSCGARRSTLMILTPGRSKAVSRDHGNELGPSARRGWAGVGPGPVASCRSAPPQPRGVAGHPSSAIGHRTVLGPVHQPLEGGPLALGPLFTVCALFDAGRRPRGPIPAGDPGMPGTDDAERSLPARRAGASSRGAGRR